VVPRQIEFAACGTRRPLCFPLVFELTRARGPLAAPGASRRSRRGTPPLRGPEECRVRVQVLGGAGFHDLLDQLRQGHGSHHRSGNASQRSVRREIGAQAPCAVNDCPVGPTVAYRRILVTTDFSDHSARRWRWAVAFARARKVKQLVCFNGYQVPTANTNRHSGSSSARIPRPGRQTALEEFRQRINCGRADELSLFVARVRWWSRHPPGGRAAESDLLVNGCPWHGPLAAALLGSTPHRSFENRPFPRCLSPRAPVAACWMCCSGRAFVARFSCAPESPIVP